MLITHTGDVAETRAAMGSGGWLLALADRSSGLTVNVLCKGPLIEAAKMAKVGQVFEVVGWVARAPSGSRVPVVPFILRAKSGVNEEDINRKTAVYTTALIEGSNPTLEAEVLRLKTEGEAARSHVNKVTDELRDRIIENRELRERIEVLDQQLRAEKIMNNAMETP